MAESRAAGSSGFASFKADQQVKVIEKTNQARERELQLLEMRLQNDPFAAGFWILDAPQ